MTFLRRRERTLISVSLVLFTLSCRPPSSSVTNDNSTTETIVSSTPPFQTKEPDRYRATRTITTSTANGQTVTTKILIARDGEMRRNESQMAAKTVTYLEGPEGRFVLLADEKIYSDVVPGTILPATEAGDALERSPEGLLHMETGSTSYQRLGKETVDGRNTDKYRVIVNAANTGNVTVSETMIWIDDALTMPIKSETRSAEGTRVLMELSDISFEVNVSLFKIPEGYQKLGIAEFLKHLSPGTNGK